MRDNISTACRVKHPQEFDCSLRALDIDSPALEVTAELRNACIAARAVLCEALLTGEFNETSTAGAIKGINDALVRASFLE